MTDTATAAQVPVKGTVWVHPRRTNWDGSPRQYKITSVNVKSGIVHSVDDLGLKIKTRLDVWQERNPQIVSVPEVVTKAKPAKLHDALYAQIMHEAHEAGMAAGESSKPEPMFVVERANPFDDTSEIVKAYSPVMDGVCGFAYINTPGNEPFGRYVKKRGWHKAYYGGLETSVRAFNQSMERKGAYAAAYVEVLKKHGINATYSTRMD